MNQLDLIRRTLESVSSACLDNERERAVVAAVIDEALRAQFEAQLIRKEFAGCSETRGHLAVTRAIGGRRESALLEAAHKLAGGCS